jgi:hypothetical protein
MTYLMHRERVWSHGNHAKGHGSMFEQWIPVYHPTIYLYPIPRACGGSRQVGVEGAPAVLMNLPIIFCSYTGVFLLV